MRRYLLMSKIVFLPVICLLLHYQGWAQITSISLQPGSTGIDANVSGATANRSTNYGNATTITAQRSTGGSTADTLRGYLKFDLSTIPSGAIINDAKLYLYGSGSNSTSISNACYLRRVSATWTEAGAGALTWNNQPANTTTGQISIATTASATKDDTVDVTSHVQDMVTTPGGNYGWVLVLQNEGVVGGAGAKREYCSSDNSTSAKRPKLVISYYYLTASITNVLCPAATTGAIDLSFSSGSSPYTYSWSPGGATTQDITSKAAGAYTVQVTDANSISRSITLDIGYKLWWKEFYGMRQSSDGDTLVQTRPDNNWLDGVVSTNKLAASTDGWIEYKVVSTSYDRQFGFSDSSTAPGNDIDYALRLNGSGVIAKMLSGVSTNIGTYTTGDVVRIERKGTNINYLKNGKIIHSITSGVPTGTLVADIAIWSLGGKWEFLRASFAPPSNQYFWTGRTSGDWSTSTNWCYCTGTVPGATNDVVFPKPALMSAPVITTTALCNSIDVQNTATLTITSPGSLSVAGNWYSTGTINTSTGYITFSGSGTQNVRKSSGTLTLNKVKVNKPGGQLNLTGPVTITDSLKITKGKIVTTSTNILTVNDNTGVSGGSDSGYVSGPMKKVGNDMFTFPLGNTSLSSGSYHPLSITAPSSTADAFVAEYKASAQALGTAKDATLSSLSTCEYWTISHPAGTSAVKTTLGWNSNCSPGSNLVKTGVAGWNGTQWTNLGNETYTVSGSKGTLTASETNSFSSVSALLLATAKRTPWLNINTVALDSLINDGDTLYYTASGANASGTYRAGFTQAIEYSAPLGTAKKTIMLNFFSGVSPTYTKMFCEVNASGTVSNVRVLITPDTLALDTIYYDIADSVLAISNGGSSYNEQRAYPVKVVLDGGVTMSPNGDSSYDTFVVQGTTGIVSYSLTITDMYGNTIFTTTNPAVQWDGRDGSSQLVPPDTYNYEIQADGQTLSGQFTLEY